MPEHWYDYDLAWWDTPHYPMTPVMRLAVQHGLRYVRPDGTNTPIEEIQEAFDAAQAQYDAGVRPL